MFKRALAQSQRLAFRSSTAPQFNLAASQRLFSTSQNPMAGKLEGKVCLVTGAGSGIGKGIAQLFAKEGGKVVVGDLNLAAAQATVAGLDNATQHLAVGMDVTKEQVVTETYEAIKKHFGKPIDVVICNAGVQHIDPVDKLSFDNWRKIVSVHLDAAFLCTREALKQMYEQKYGKIIYIGSVHSKLASPLKAPYVSAKHGVLGLCRAVAKEGAKKGVSANVICPGFVLTPLVEKQIPEQAKELGISEQEVVKNIMLKDTVDGEFTTIDDVAQATLFFASHPTNALTGQSMIVSHGWYMQ
ncbi:predicted protein [Naegleria gruberi]|uniref:3-oxoacyl-[acyl-carrier-protein] reductase n=1 Tax=Naegleria gruberi TaxID=5762 RepID=D2W2V6_NAEGR|nr:uncharacterized protein NAEGRDRAFT_82176 [Naegleria gruberi]EFC36615.1 predicted protein [Naegleria gruberi]|eukprot:XP_002669359.1 predicted protein [Naegleria gruberi strain NEG-M]